MSPGIVAESDLTGNLKSEYVFFDGERVARKDLSGGTTSVAYYFSDHLKTASVITNSAGTITEDEDYYPWGGELQFVNSDSNHYKFTGKERDSETGLDYFGARYYGNWYGRFLSADWAEKPEAVPYSDLDDPQSLNLYSYVRNIPTSKADADGRDPPGAGGAVATAAAACAASAPCATVAVVSAPIAAPSVLAMTVAVSLPPMQNTPDGSPNLILDALNPPYIPPPPLTTTNPGQTGTPASTTTTAPTGTTTNAVDQGTKDRVKDNAGGKCEYCGKTTTTPKDTAHGASAGDEGQTDHYKPKSKGGTDDESNLAHACRDCNGPGGKGNADPTNPNDAAGQKWRLPRMENKKGPEPQQ